MSLFNPARFCRASRTLALLFALVGFLPGGLAAGQVRAFQNPIIPGFHPDPSICRVGDDYYLVNSSFEFFPGVPIFHSRDLVHWRQIGYCLTRKSQLNLDHARASGGIYAPTLRYHNGTFYMITTLVDTGGNFFVTATNPAGPWSEPVWVDHAGIDPSLLFDEDGTVYYDRHEGMADGFIGQAKINLQTGKLDGDFKEVWRGTGGVWPEGPHLYKINGKYFIMIAEGGTSYDHMETIARSDSPWGPFIPNPRNPILTHRNRPDSPIQALGHADLVETPDGWWLVCLGIRPQGGRFHHLGRETFLAPVTWSEDGWPVVNGKGTLETNLTAPRLPQHPWEKDSARDKFNPPALGPPVEFSPEPVCRRLFAHRTSGLAAPQRFGGDIERPGFTCVLSAAARRTWHAAPPPGFPSTRSMKMKRRDWSCTATRKIITKLESPSKTGNGRCSSAKPWTAKPSNRRNMRKSASEDVILSVVASPWTMNFPARRRKVRQKTGHGLDLRFVFGKSRRFHRCVHGPVCHRQWTKEHPPGGFRLV